MIGPVEANGTTAAATVKYFVPEVVCSDVPAGIGNGAGFAAVKLKSTEPRATDAGLRVIV